MADSRTRTPEELRAAAYGIDLSLLDAALEQSPTERVEAHERALELMLELRKAGESHREEPPATTAPVLRERRS